MPPAGYRATHETEIKRSRFIATIVRADSEAEARAALAAVRAAYPDARHHCFAYVVEADGVRRAGSSDGGEPAGTAGVPMMNALTNAGVVNVAAIVTRYFGGVKLGAGGLTRAYGGAVAQALAAMPRVVREVRPVWSVRLPHAGAGRTVEELVRSGAQVMGTAYDADAVTLRLTYPGDVASVVARATGGTARPTPDGVHLVEVPLPT